jgi:hypothetical protein
MPFEVWKTHMGTYRTQGTVESFLNIYRKAGIASFWSGATPSPRHFATLRFNAKHRLRTGWQPKMVESFLKGGILLFSKDAIIRASLGSGMSEIAAGVLGGFGGGVAQVVVLGPCTYLVTASVTAPPGTPIASILLSTYRARGIGGFYHGGTALMLRQGSNWASRQFFTDAARSYLRSRHGDSKSKLSITEEALSGIFGNKTNLTYHLLKTHSNK